MYNIPISTGELLDKYTILLLKLYNITDKDKLQNVQKEFDLLQTFRNTILKQFPEITLLEDDLFKTNSKLWKVEDGLRKLDKINSFKSEFIDLARSVYQLNDKRALLKKEINLITKSGIVEEKSYG